MADEWDGITERRGRPHEYELRNIIREEIEPIKRNQETIQEKIKEWELGAKWFRIFIIGTVGLVTMLAGIYEWMRTHIR